MKRREVNIICHMTEWQIEETKRALAEAGAGDFATAGEVREAYHKLRVFHCKQVIQ